MLNPGEKPESSSTKSRVRPAHESIGRPQSEQGDKAQKVANKAAEKGQVRMKRNEDVRGPFRNFGQ